MFKRTSVILGRCTQDCLRSRRAHPNLSVRLHHLANTQVKLSTNAQTKQEYLKVLANFKNKGIYQDQIQRNGHPNQTPKKLGDGSIGVIHVQEHESADLANPIQRRFLHDLEIQQVQRLKEEKKRSQDDIGSQTKQITMSAGKKDSGKKKECKEKDTCKKEDPCEAAKKKKTGISEKCKALAEKDKCRKLAEEKKRQEELKKCKEIIQKAKCREMAEKAECEKKAKKEKCKKKDSGKKKEPSKKTKGKDGDLEKKCKEMKEKEKCKELDDKEKCKKLAEKKKKDKKGSDKEDECEEE